MVTADTPLTALRDALSCPADAALAGLGAAPRGAYLAIEGTLYEDLRPNGPSYAAPVVDFLRAGGAEPPPPVPPGAAEARGVATGGGGGAPSITPSPLSPGEGGARVSRPTEPT